MIKYIQLAILVVVLAPTAYIDIKKRIIPNLASITLLTFKIGILIYYYFLGTGVNEIINALIGGFVALILCVLSRLVVSEGLGMGDIKLLIAIGIFLGCKDFLFALLLISVLSFVISLWLILTKKAGKTATLPFAPFIFIGSTLAQIFSGGDFL